MPLEDHRNQSPTTGPDYRPGSRRKLPDPPDPDNLPIDYPGPMTDLKRFQASVQRGNEAVQWIAGDALRSAGTRPASQRTSAAR
ncbi:hypothetical protein ACIQC5_09410 [Paenarthrobacter sp. NPDC092416]|uniref:hypothetical protein n=1 Tax=Paenarthrobacter sp. NPDC092416 TaxID=3364386 RepID=UPI0038105BCD